jgi:hypothetical protein
MADIMMKDLPDLNRPPNAADKFPISSAERGDSYNVPFVLLTRAIAETPEIADKIADVAGQKIADVEADVQTFFKSIAVAAYGAWDKPRMSGAEAFTALLALLARLIKLGYVDDTQNNAGYAADYGIIGVIAPPAQSTPAYSYDWLQAYQDRFRPGGTSNPNGIW